MTSFDELSIGEARLIWPRLKPMVDAALSRNGPIDKLLQQELEVAVLNGRAQVLLAPDGFGVVYCAGGAANLVAYVGSLREIRDLAPAFMAWVKQRGCNKIRVIGSRAWLRAFPGLTERATVLELSLDA